MADRQQLAAQCCSLQKDNEQLAELVGRYSLALQDQQQQQLGGTLSYGHQGTAIGLPAHLPQGLPAALLPSQQPQPQFQHHTHKQLHKVSEWLERRSTPAEQDWLAWQERLPLEHMNSGSSSSLTVALEQQQ